ncbi:hypothetical protein EMPG_13086 [Blastomyces silverae]|uniref:L-ornithine N(5)-monooxygenase n=1 Tax=Blastomyces silverae TaxID=2060906 RepID=A0A0H1BKU9_9EURO|nr:hypothetical protein EMPG_13086 [Blastomyces silverae]
MAEKSTVPTSVDVVIVGNGPSAMILSYILHGHIPFYNPEKPHPDPLLHAKLKDNPQLLHLDIGHLTNHFGASRFPYSTQALPVNVLLDALIRPNGDDDEGTETSVQWRYMPERAASHLIFGDAVHPGGQWTECPEGTAPNIQTLSYAGMLSLPGYSFAEHHQRVHACPLPPFTRPSREAVAEYLAAYATFVGISESIRCSQKISGVVRAENGFYIGSHNITCNKLILASGVFTERIPPRPLLLPLLKLPPPTTAMQPRRAPLLIIGSGFSAADVIISSHSDQKIIHIFKWEPETNPSPLKSCHQQEYPEYASIYRLMKRAFAQSKQSAGTSRPKRARGHSIPFLESRNWKDNYEGIPNTVVTDVVLDNETALVTFRRQDGTTLSREVSGLAYVVGRRSSLNYLSKRLLAEIFDNEMTTDDCKWVSRPKMRARALEGLEVTKDVFIIGSLTGDSLIRFAYGGCIYAAGKLMPSDFNERNGYVLEDSCSKTAKSKDWTAESAFINGAEGHNNVRRIENKSERQADIPREKHIRPDSVANPPKSWWGHLISLFTG